MITLKHVHYEIPDEVSKNEKVHNSFIKNLNALFQQPQLSAMTVQQQVRILL